PTPVEAPPPPERPDPPVDQAALRRERAESARAATARAEAAAASPASRNMRDYLAGVEQALIARGRLRIDSGDEIALTPEKLTDTFIEVALYDEYVREGGKLVSRPTPAPLRRWQQPVLLRLEFGDSVAPDQRARDRAEIAGFAARLAGISGHPVAVTGGAGNVAVLILNEDERRAVGPRLAALVPGIPPGDIAALRDLAPQNYCTVFAYSNGNSPVYAQAVALIRAELPPRLRRSCIHEELAQGMGLANDSPRARPSIFNDNEEFAYLTRHDELLLQILYDARLRPGMTEAEARPIVLQIARELLETEA
ncbi:DUF2927 domain-containing protein, partial [Paracoccus versutus]